MIGSKAREVLAGGSPYCRNEGAAVDRSAQLTGFVKELYSWVNLLNDHRMHFSGSLDDLIGQAVAALAIEDKADRVVATGRSIPEIIQGLISSFPINPAEGTSRQERTGWAAASRNQIRAQPGSSPGGWCSMPTELIEEGVGMAASAEDSQTRPRPGATQGRFCE